MDVLMSNKQQSVSVALKTYKVISCSCTRVLLWLGKSKCFPTWSACKAVKLHSSQDEKSEGLGILWPVISFKPA